MRRKMNLNNINNYNEDEFYLKYRKALSGLQNSQFTGSKKCLVFDFDNCLINLMKIQMEIYHTQQLPIEMVEQFLDTYTELAEPIRTTWDIIYRSQDTIIILSGNKYENILKWLVKHNRDKYINDIISIWDLNQDVAQKKFQKLKFLSEVYDKVTFFDDSLENLVINAGLKNVELMKVTPEII